MIGNRAIPTLEELMALPYKLETFGSNYTGGIGNVCSIYFPMKMWICMFGSPEVGMNPLMTVVFDSLNWTLLDYETIVLRENTVLRNDEIILATKIACDASANDLMNSYHYQDIFAKMMEKLLDEVYKANIDADLRCQASFGE